MADSRTGTGNIYNEAEASCSTREKILTTMGLCLRSAQVMILGPGIEPEPKADAQPTERATQAP